jgi:hypothetical protein
MANAAYYGNKPTSALRASASLNFPSMATLTSAELTITVTGAAVGDAVALAPPASVEAGLVWCGRVSAANTVTVRMYNSTASTVDPVAATWGVTVLKA